MNCPIESEEYSCVREQGHLGAHWAYVLDKDGLSIVEWFLPKKHLDTRTLT